MKTEMEIARAHDLLCGVVVGDVPASIDARTKERLCCALDVLCWVLEHKHDDCGGAFEENLHKVERAAALLGYVLTRREN